MADDFEAQFLAFLALAVMLAGQRDKRFGQPDKADGKGAML